MNQQPKQIGKSFAFIFWGLLLVFFYFFFEEKLLKQVNPNQTPHSYSVGNQQLTVLKRNRFGHYVTNGTINNQDVIFMLDTGATTVAVPSGVANYLNLPRGAEVRVNTANGIGVAYQTQIRKLTLGEIELYDVRASIVPGMQGEQILLGMSVLKQVEFSQVGDELTLKLVR
ncbi:MAG: retroviral-like aspartic protease family protein [Gammaproteobacteria bacterium]|nr:retroviral-like aspartic protease family protein [Gammaproteobacteria bacterium]